MSKWLIYKLQNPKGGTYIGCTSNIVRRLKQYKGMLSVIQKQRRLYESLMEHGFNNHKLEMLEECEGDYLGAESREMFWIRTNMSNFSKWPKMNGLNLTNGGGGALGHIGSLKGMNRPRHVCEKISIGKSGIKASETHRKNISESHIGAVSPKRKAIYQVDLNGNIINEYDSISEASKKHNCSASCIVRVLKREYPNYKGVIFKYK